MIVHHKTPSRLPPSTSLLIAPCSESPSETLFSSWITLYISVKIHFLADRMIFLPVSQLGPVKPCGQAHTLAAIQAPPFLQPSLQNAKIIQIHDFSTLEVSSSRYSKPSFSLSPWRCGHQTINAILISYSYNIFHTSKRLQHHFVKQCSF